jgi:hypothetical protein
LSFAGTRPSTPDRADEGEWVSSASVVIGWAGVEADICQYYWSWVFFYSIRGSHKLFTVGGALLVVHWAVGQGNPSNLVFSYIIEKQIMALVSGMRVHRPKKAIFLECLNDLPHESGSNFEETFSSLPIFRKEYKQQRTYA